MLLPSGCTTPRVAASAMAAAAASSRPREAWSSARSADAPDADGGGLTARPPRPSSPTLSIQLGADAERTGGGMPRHAVTLLGTGLIGDFYSQTLTSHRRRDEVRVVYSRTSERAGAFAERWGIPEHTTDLARAVEHPDTDVVVVGQPNHLHEEAVALAARAGKAVLCTKPLARNAEEARRILEVVEGAGVFAGYLEDLCCHCIEIIRSFVGKGNRPVDVMCWADTFVHPIDDEDNAVALIRFESGAIGQFEVSWTFRGGMDLRDEVAGTDGTIWLNHFLRTGFDIFTTGGAGGYVAEKAESERGWLFPGGG